jgi:hypothetical protein
MMNATEALLSSFDGHDDEGVLAALQSGADPCSHVRGKPPILWLLGEYTRSNRLAKCIRLLLEYGAKVPVPLLTPVLMNDACALRTAIELQPDFVHHRTSLTSAFTSLEGVTLLHVAAEYGNLEAAQVLIDAGADVNATAFLDEDGLNGHTPLFHTVNSNQNRSEPIMKLLLAAGARTDICLAGLHWGKGYEWETTFFDVTPISYAQLGLMPQLHRSEKDIYANVRHLLEQSGRPVPSLNNVPNRYLRSK